MNNMIAALARSRGMVREAAEYEELVRHLEECRDKLEVLLTEQSEALLHKDLKAYQRTFTALRKTSTEFRRLERKLDEHSLPIILARQTEVVRRISGNHGLEVGCG